VPQITRACHLGLVPRLIRRRPGVKHRQGDKLQQTWWLIRPVPVGTGQDGLQKRHAKRCDQRRDVAFGNQGVADQREWGCNGHASNS